MNQMIKYLKFGFGKVTEYVNEELRLGRIGRAEAIYLVEQYDGKCADHYIQSFCEFIGVDKETFWSHVHNAMNRELFEIDQAGNLRRKFTVGVGN